MYAVLPERGEGGRRTRGANDTKELKEASWTSVRWMIEYLPRALECYSALVGCGRKGRMLKCAIEGISAKLSRIPRGMSDWTRASRCRCLDCWLGEAVNVAPRLFTWTVDGAMLRTLFSLQLA